MTSPGADVVPGAPPPPPPPPKLELIDGKQLVTILGKLKTTFKPAKFAAFVEAKLAESIRAAAASPLQAAAVAEALATLRVKKIVTPEQHMKLSELLAEEQLKALSLQARFIGP